MAKAFSNLNHELQSVEGFDFNIANKIYVDGKYELDPKFSDYIKDIFNSEVENVNFTARTETANEINNWVVPLLFIINDYKDIYFID